jgi:hypothetical protein
MQSRYVWSLSKASFTIAQEGPDLARLPTPRIALTLSRPGARIWRILRQEGDWCRLAV